MKASLPVKFRTAEPHHQILGIKPSAVLDLENGICLRDDRFVDFIEQGNWHPLVPANLHEAAGKLSTPYDFVVRHIGADGVCHGRDEDFLDGQSEQCFDALVTIPLINKADVIADPLKV